MISIFDKNLVKQKIKRSHIMVVECHLIVYTNISGGIRFIAGVEPCRSHTLGGDVDSGCLGGACLGSPLAS